jgi:hypothetical protein
MFAINGEKRDKSKHISEVDIKSINMYILSSEAKKLDKDAILKENV